MSDAAFDLLVVGAGPAGASAAIAAAQRGLRVLIVDENPTAGGQIFRKPAVSYDDKSASSDTRAGDALRERLAQSGVTTRFEHRVWLAQPGFELRAIGPDGPVAWRAPNLVVATGAVERHRPVPGWTLPGVFGLAAATNLLKAHGVLPGKRTLVAGSGPLLYLVAAKILEAGGALAGVVDARRSVDWLAATPGMLARPDLALRGARWLLDLKRAGVPIYRGNLLRRLDGHESVRSAVVGPVDKPSVSIAVDCDSVCFGYGLLPASELARLLGAPHCFDPESQSWVPMIDGEGRCAIEGLYLCGDGAGILGAAAAARQGARVGNAAATKRNPGPLAVPHDPFGAAMTRLSVPPDAALAAITPETIVCRCENLTRATLEAAIGAGARTINALKAATRCGMGACGGRVCEDAAAALMAATTGASRAAVGQATARPPLRPVPLAVLAGDFDYASLPMPAPAPE